MSKFSFVLSCFVYFSLIPLIVLVNIGGHFLILSIVLLGDDCSADIDIRAWFSIDTESRPAGRASTGADILGDNLYVYGGETLLNRYTIHSNYSVGFYR